MPMKRHAPSFLAFVLVLSLLPFFGAEAQAQRATISVSTAADFIRALGSDRTVFLQSGDYVLSSAYGTGNPDIEWQDSAEGKELVLRGLHDLTIRGVSGTRIIVDSPTVYFLDVISAVNLQIDNVIFSRKPASGGSDVSAGGLYFDGCNNIELDRIAFEGSNGYPLELSDCSQARFNKCRLTQGFNGALSLTGCTDISLDGCTLWRNQGGPLLSVEESSSVSFSSCLFTDNEGGIFIDIYSDRVAAWNIRFDSCIFRDNRFDYFAKDSFLPTTDSCSFDGNSFGEDWVSTALAPAPQGDSPSSYIPGVALSYAFPDSGLGLRYPSGWDLEEGPKGSRVGFFSPSGQAFLLFSPLDVAYAPGGSGAAPAYADFDAAADSLCRLLKAEAGFDVSIQAESAPVIEPSGLLGVLWQGMATKAGGGSASVRVRFLAAGSRIYALAAFAADPMELIEGSDTGNILMSFGPASGTAAK